MESVIFEDIIPNGLRISDEKHSVFLAYNDDSCGGPGVHQLYIEQRRIINTENEPEYLIPYYSGALLIEKYLKEGEQPIKINCKNIARYLPRFPEETQLVVRGNGIELTGMTNDLFNHAIIKDESVKQRALENFQREQERARRALARRALARERQRQAGMVGIEDQEALNSKVLEDNYRRFQEAIQNAEDKGDKKVLKLLTKMTDMTEKESIDLLKENLTKLDNLLMIAQNKAEEKNKFRIIAARHCIKLMKHDPNVRGFNDSPFGGRFTDYQGYRPTTAYPSIAQLFNFNFAMIENEHDVET